MHTGKGNSRATLPPPQTAVGSGPSGILPHNLRPLFKDAHKPKESVTGEPSSGPSSSNQTGAGSVKSLCWSFLATMTMLRTLDCSSGTWIKLDDISNTQWGPFDLSSISLPPTSLFPVMTRPEAKYSGKHRREYKTEENLKNKAARAQRRAKFDSGVSSTSKADAANA
ncbi:hypothetical protein BGZ47_006415 [Haplosporangium gracile]|nr:hypothetical protein BGZ47_006415 [Haplosporangium gracile]